MKAEELAALDRQVSEMRFRDAERERAAMTDDERANADLKLMAFNTGAESDLWCKVVLLQIELGHSDPELAADRIVLDFRSRTPLAPTERSLPEPESEPRSIVRTPCQP